MELNMGRNKWSPKVRSTVNITTIAITITIISTNINIIYITITVIITNINIIYITITVIITIVIPTAIGIITITIITATLSSPHPPAPRSRVKWSRC